MHVVYLCRADRFTAFDSHWIMFKSSHETKLSRGREASTGPRSPERMNREQRTLFDTGANVR